MTAAVRLDDDELPVWTYRPGETIADGLQAWQRLGVGHRCETWLAWSAPTWSPVVIKLARPHQVDHPRARASLHREQAALHDLVHPGLPRLISAAIDHPLPHLVLEYVDGLALDDLLADQGGLDDRSVALLGAQLLAALVPVHGRGLAHLDVKPENVMVRDGRPVLVDFGSARRIGTRQPPGHPVGTLGWAPPEMEACRPISAAMDVYGVGRVLQACLTPRAGHRPGPTGGRLRDLVAKMTSPEPSARPDLPRAVRAIGDVLPRSERPWPAWR